MLKKITIIVLCLCLSLSALVGCTLVTDNNEKNSKQVIAKVSTFTESGNDRHDRTEDGYFVYNPSEEFLLDYSGTSYDKNTEFFVKNDEVFVRRKDGNNYVYDFVYDMQTSDLTEKYVSWSYTYNNGKDKDIYKYQLYSYVNNYLQSYVDNYGYTTEKAVEFFVDQLLLREVTLAEAQKYIEKGDIVLDKAYYNDIARNIYSAIDSQYNAYLTEILKEQGKEVPETLEEETTTEPTFPLYPYGEADEEVEPEIWNVKDQKNASKWPGMSGSLETKSRELEAMTRFVKGLKNAVKGDIRLTKAERERIDNEFKEIDNIINSLGIEKIYPMLGDTFIIEYLIGRSVVEDKKIALLTDFINGDTVATDDEILAEFNRTVRNQTEQFDEDIQNYYSAADEKLMLVNPDPTKHVYVKHLLLQFSAEQTAELDAYKKSYGSTETGYLALRDRLAKQIVGYEHVNGEDDLSKPIPIDTIERTIRSQMAAAGASTKEAHRTFDKLIYKYNQDPGSFSSELGYSLSRVLADGETDTYVKEFAAGAREFVNAKNSDGSKKYKVGDILEYGVVTQFGVHYMFYSYERPTGNVSIHDYVTTAEYETYYDLLKEAVLSKKSQSLFTDWQNQTFDRYKEIDKTVEVYESRYSDIY